MQADRKTGKDGKVLIVGGGPAGLGAAWRLHEAGHVNWELFEKAPHVGGLASSYVDERGFTWDLGGHVVFSHYPYFDRVLDLVLKEEWIEHVRQAWVWMRERFIPYPLQNNIRRLPTPELLECLEGLLDVRNHSGPPPATFADWIQQSFGAGLARVFMNPYNRKVWATDPAELSAGWVGDRIATIDLKRVLRNIIEGRDDLGWGPNATFRFPLHGGTGRIWQAIAERLPADRLHLDAEVVGIDATAKTVCLADGRTAGYDWLVTTMPLDVLVRMVSNLRSPDGLRYSATHVIGVGLDGRAPEPLASKCWMYFPEPELPFYRVTVFSNYAPNNVPSPGRQWSLMAEVSEPGPSCGGTGERTWDAGRSTRDEIVQRTLDGLREARLIPPNAAVTSLWHRRIERGYPTPSLYRDKLLEEIEPALYALNILSRGRFGAWKYEVANMDHSFMQGVEAVNHILLGEPETTVKSPSVVNSRPRAGE